MEFIVAIVATIAGIVGMRLYDRREISRLREKSGFLTTENFTLRNKVNRLEAALREAKRAPMDHDAVGKRLQELARGAERGVV